MDFTIHTCCEIQCGFTITTCLYQYLPVAIFSALNRLAGITLLPYLHDIPPKLPHQGDLSDWCPTKILLNSYLPYFHLLIEY